MARVRPYRRGGQLLRHTAQQRTATPVKGKFKLAGAEPLYRQAFERAGLGEPGVAMAKKTMLLLPLGLRPCAMSVRCGP